ncbi:CRISPR system precrRNA processing endoribonuclease RAMP protein Cas6 [Malaciobacter sp. WC5094]
MRYSKIDFKINSKIKPPMFMGSQLRGAFGYALKKVVCVNPSYECENCFAKDTCLYHEFFVLQNNYHKYRFDINLDEDFYKFSFFLFSEACEKLPFVLSSFYELFTSIGLGKENHTFDDFEILINNETAYKNKNFTIPKEYVQNYLYKKEFEKNVVINLLTPLRIKKNGTFILDDTLALEDILKSIKKRFYTLTNKELEKKVLVDESFKVINKNLHKKQLVRYSNLKKQKMNFDGLVGSIVISNLNEENYNLLKIGELLGVGKQTVFGLGKIEVKGI